jgi:glycogen phosphorylase
MKPVRTFTVTRPLPARVAALQEIAYNLWWSWDEDAQALFARLHPDLWELTHHNPLLVLDRCDRTRLDALAEDAEFLAHLDRVSGALASYMAGAQTWHGGVRTSDRKTLVAYFSAEFAITESLPIFSGGLGVLAGDHLKSASDLGIPLVGVGMLYGKGYFQQQIDAEGRQVESYVERHVGDLPVRLEHGPDGSAINVEIPFPGRRVHAHVWRAQVGRVPLFLLDTNHPANWAEDREITAHLYGGDNENRIKQEMILGIGGVRALEAMGLAPAVLHMNEGHSAFLALERIHRLMQERGLSFAAAREAASAGMLFTTHTPVEAGHDYFPPDLMELYLGSYARDLGLSFPELMAMGRRDASNTKELFCMTILALRSAGYANGVSELHGAVSRRMWRGIWNDLPEEEVPIGHVTNGVHLPTWVGMPLARLFDERVGPGWRAGTATAEDWRRIADVPDADLWNVHQERKAALIGTVRRAWQSQLRRSGAKGDEIAAVSEVISPNVLTIGFARRFATYKRATLMLRQRRRFERLIASVDRPVQFVFAGKAHPRDAAGKELIHAIQKMAREAPFRGRVLFLEDYDPAIARALVQGADVWMNTPRRPLEASGTSGMKAAANGVLNLSVLDGWWPEAWQLTRDYGQFGWAFGLSDAAETTELQDEQDAEDLLTLLEQEVVPLYYDRDANGIPTRWIEFMKACIAANAPVFNTDRMLQEYTARYYHPLEQRFDSMSENDFARARSLAEWKTRVEESWPDVHISALAGELPSSVPAGRDLLIQALVEPGGLSPDELRAEVLIGKVNGTGELSHSVAAPMRLIEQTRERGLLYEAAIAPPSKDGLQGFTVRVIPHHEDLVSPFLPGFVAWADEEDEDDLLRA